MIVRVLVEAGATYASASHAAVILENGGTVAEAAAVIATLPEPGAFGVDAMLAALERERELAAQAVRRGT